MMSERRRRRGFGTNLALLGLATIGLLVAGCSGGSKGPQVASVRGTTTTVALPGKPGQSEDLQLAQCMRSQGVPNFPDPPANGAFLNALSASGVNTHSSTYQTALEACKKYTQAGTLTPQSAADEAKALQYSQCMRSHGVPNFPDPTTGPADEQVIDLRGLGIDLSSPTFQAAGLACKKVVPGFGK
jgi:hypothetical protein